MLIKYTGILLIFITLCMIGRFKALNVKKELMLLRELESRLVSSKLSLKFDKKKSLDIINSLRETSESVIRR